MGSIFKSVRQSWQRHCAEHELHKWKRRRSVVDGNDITHHFDLGDIYVDLFWHATINGKIREVLYTRLSFGKLKKQLQHIENERIAPSFRALLEAIDESMNTACQ